MTLQEHYNAIKNGKGNKTQFLKQARYLFPEYVNQYSSFDSATNVLKSKQIISEAAGGVVSKGFDIWDWKKILAEETKATEKETSKEVTDKQAHAYNNKDMKNADNVNFNEIMKGFYCEMKDEKNKDKTGDELKAMVVKNLAKDPLYYTKNGEFGTKGVGYTDEAPGLGTNTQPTSKEATVLGGNDKVDSDSDIVKNSLVGSAKKNVKDTLSDSESKDSMPKKVKEMPDKGVTGVEKKIKLKEEEIKWERQSLNENVYVDLASAIAALGGATAISAEVKQKLKAAKEKGKDELTKLVNQLKGAKKKSVNENTEEKSKAEKWAKLTDKAIANIELEEGMYQGRSVKLAKSGGLGGRRFIPTVTVLSREAIDDINAKGVKRANWDKPHIKVIKSGEDEVKLLISQLLLDAIVGSQRGRTQTGPSKGASIKGTGITSDETKELSGEFKKLVKVLNAGSKLSKTGDYYLLDIPIKYNDKLNRYEMPLPSEITEVIAEEKLRSLIQQIIKEELNENKYAKSFLDAIKPAGLDINVDPESDEFADLEDAAYDFIKRSDIENLRPEKLVYDARLYAKKSNEELNEYGEDSGGQDMTWGMYKEKPGKEKGGNQGFIDKGYEDYYDGIPFNTPAYEFGKNKYYGGADLAKLWQLGWKKAEAEDKGLEFIEDEPNVEDWNDQTGDYDGANLNEGSIEIKGKTVRTYTQNGDKSYNVTYDDGTKDRIAVSNDAWDKINTLHQNAIKEELNDENNLDNRLKNYVENEFSKENWKSIKNYYLEMTQDKPEPKKAYFKLVDGILKKHGY